ncbi:DUF1059 domain-containing protein [Nocardioides sp. GCM10027113]|uniref:DUF1059 domain-containing protein n=1 Tax=unclassified Nocardioides TaxID=2615069 RepID=UPI003616A542
MSYQVACGDIMPGCSAHFETETREELMQQVARHAAEVHGITNLTPDIQQTVDSKIVTA